MDSRARAHREKDSWVEIQRDKRYVGERSNLNPAVHCIRQQHINQWKVIFIFRTQESETDPHAPKYAATRRHVVEVKQLFSSLSFVRATIHFRFSSGRWERSLTKAKEANLFKVTMTDDVHPRATRAPRGLQACMNIALILKQQAWQNTFCSLIVLVKWLHQTHTTRSETFSSLYHLRSFFFVLVSYRSHEPLCSYMMALIILDGELFTFFYRSFGWCASIVAESKTHMKLYSSCKEIITRRPNRNWACTFTVFLFFQSVFPPSNFNFSSLSSSFLSCFKLSDEVTAIIK